MEFQLKVRADSPLADTPDEKKLLLLWRHKDWANLLSMIADEIHVEQLQRAQPGGEG